MKKFKVVLLLFTFVISSCSSDKKSMIPDENNDGLILPEGFSAIVVADNLGRGRHITVDEKGVIYVSLSEQKNGGGIARLKDTDGDGRADEIKYFGDCKGTGIEVYKDYLYFGTDTSVIRFALDAQGEPSENFETVITGYPYETQHSAKNFTFDGEGNIYVNIGAPSNACQQDDRTALSPGMDPCPLLDTYGGIWKYSATELNQIHKQHGSRYATGLRNAMALYWNASVQKLYAVSHGRDQLYPLYKEFFTEEQSVNLPAEEMFLINEGDDLGWPYCYSDPFENKKKLNPEYGGDGEITGRCDTLGQPIVAFPAHYAPNDLLFYTGKNFPEMYRHGAFVAFHGSWNRSPQMQEGFNIVFVPFQDEQPSGEWSVFADNFAGTKQLYGPGDAAHRPCGLALGPDGSMYVVDSKNGKVWRIFYKG